MGILVTGAEKVERQVGRLRVNLKTRSEVVGGADARIKQAWKAVENQIERGASTSLREMDLRGRRFLKIIIESTIRELEKFSRRLEGSGGVPGHAA